jgi:hypothetical protein
MQYPVEGWADEEEFTALDILDFDSSDEDTADGDDFYPDVSRERQQVYTYFVFDFAESNECICF